MTEEKDVIPECPAVRDAEQRHFNRPAVRQGIFILFTYVLE
jgi:hypothetical protein